MSSFEEEFPSLKTSIVDVDCEQCANEYGHIINYEPTAGILLSNVQKFCLDKQRVREIIDDLQKRFDEECAYHIVDWSVVRIALGLEDDEE